MKDLCRCNGLKDSRAKQCTLCRLRLPSRKNCSSCHRLKSRRHFRIQTRRDRKLPRPGAVCRKCEKLNKVISRKKFPSRWANRTRKQAIKRQFGEEVGTRIIALLGTQKICLICKKKKRLCVDHCHKSKKFRGLICDTCNHGLGNFKDSIELLSRAIDYLKENNMALKKLKKIRTNFEPILAECLRIILDAEFGPFTTVETVIRAGCHGTYWEKAARTLDEYHKQVNAG